MFSGLSFRHSNNHLWRVTCHGNVPLLSFAWPLLHPALRQLHQLMGFAYSQFQTDNHLLLSQPNLIPNTCTYTHAPMLILECVGGCPNVLVVLISSQPKTHLKEYRRFAWCIATMRLPPIWESGSVWTLWMSEDKIIAYMHHEDIVAVSRFMYTMYQYQYNVKLFFLTIPDCDHLSSVSKWH